MSHDAMASTGSFYNNGKRGSAPHPSSTAPAEGTFKWRCAGPQTHVILNEDQANMVKLPIQRRILLNWSQAGRDQLAARSREKADFGAKTLVLPDWVDEEGVRWLVAWMIEKCNMEDEDDHLRTIQQAEERNVTLKPGIRVPDGNNLPLLMKLQQAAVALHLPGAINHISEALLTTIRQRPMDVSEMKLFWELFGFGAPRLTIHRVLELQAGHMMAGTPGDYEAIEAFADKEENVELRYFLRQKCEGIWRENGRYDAGAASRRDSVVASSSGTDTAVQSP